jgi:hypothetical protein
MGNGASAILKQIPKAYSVESQTAEGTSEEIAQKELGGDTIVLTDFHCFAGREKRETKD